MLNIIKHKNNCQLFSEIKLKLVFIKKEKENVVLYNKIIIITINFKQFTFQVNSLLF
jgi:hypothetical protein